MSSLHNFIKLLNQVFFENYDEFFDVFVIFDQFKNVFAVFVIEIVDFDLFYQIEYEDLVDYVLFLLLLLI